MFCLRYIANDHVKPIHTHTQSYAHTHVHITHTYTHTRCRCWRTAHEAGGLLFRCVDCPTSLCEECLPDGFEPGTSQKGRERERCGEECSMMFWPEHWTHVHTHSHTHAHTHTPKHTHTHTHVELWRFHTYDTTHSYVYAMTHPQVCQTHSRSRRDACMRNVTGY